MTKGLCSQIAERVKCDNADKAVINADELLGIIYNSVDLSQIPTEEKDRFILGFLLRIILNQLGYRSVIRQKKVYVNPELMDSKELDVLLDNTNLDISNLEKIKNKLSELKNNCEGQMSFNSDMDIQEELTTEQLFDLLTEKYAI